MGGTIQNKSQIPASDWPLVSVFMPCYNAMKWLPAALPSLLGQDYPYMEVIVNDDASTDGTADYIQRHFPMVTLIRNPTNRGLDATLNHGFWNTKGEYFFMVNQDTVHSPDYLRKCVARLEANPWLASVCGKILKYDLASDQKTNIIDTVGLQGHPDRRVSDIGQGEPDEGQYEVSREVFGVSGQNPLYRRLALEQVAIPVPGQNHPQVFDEDFYMYKEEVDLAWRLQLMGWKSWYEADAVAWHGRSTVAVKRQGYWGIIRNRSRIGSREVGSIASKSQRFHSIKNRYLMILKNEFPLNYLLNFPRILLSDILYFGYNLVFDTGNLRAYFAALGKVPSIWRKRKWIIAHRTARPAEINKWFKAKNSK